MFFSALTKPQRIACFLALLIAASTVIAIVSNSTLDAEQIVVTPKSVEELDTPEEVALFLDRALRVVQRDSRALRRSPVAKAAQQDADELLRLAIQWLNGKVEIKPTESAAKDSQTAEQTLLGVWRHTLKIDGTENLLIFGPEKKFVAYRGGQVWTGNWEQRDGLLYTQNVRDSAEDFIGMNLPDIQKVTSKDDQTFELNSVASTEHPGFTLSRIR